MAEEAKKRHSHKRYWIAAVAGVFLLAIVAALAWYLRSPQFEDLVRRKVIATLEDASGGRVDLKAFRWNLSTLTFQADGLTIHGLEAPDQLPYVHVDHMLARLHIISFVERQVSLEYVEVQRPVIHVIVYPDGTTNAPEPAIRQPGSKSTIQELFNLAVSRVNIHQGTLLLNERKLPLDCSANDILASMTYDHLAERYDGSVQVGKIDAKYQDFRDLPLRADLQFSLWRGKADIKSLKITSEDSTLQASGQVTDFRSPQLQLTFASTANLAQLGAIARVYPLRAGTVILGASGSYSEAAGYASRGRIAFRDLDYLDSGIAVRKANLNANFSFENDVLRLSQIAARALGGQITGEAEIKNLLPTAPVPEATPASGKVASASKAGADKSRKQNALAGRSAETPVQQGSARLRLAGVSLAEVARMASSRSLPLDKLNAAGSLTGSVNLAWKQALADASADLALDVAAPKQPSDYQLPVNGSLRGRYSVRAERIDLSALNLTTPHTRLDATGTMGATTAALNLNLSSDNLTEFQPLLSAMGNAPLPVELAGSANFKGTLNGRLSAPDLAGHLQATNFTYLYTSTTKPAASMPTPPPKKSSWFHRASAPPPPPQPVTTTRRIHIDQFSGDVRYSQSEMALHHAVLDEGGAQLTVDGTTALSNGDFTDNSQFHIQAAIHNGDAASLQRAAGWNYPVAGKLNFTLQALGTLADPHGHGSISLAEGDAYGRPIKSFTSKIVFANRAAQLDDIHLQAARGTVAGSAAYNWHTESVNFDLTGHSINLADIPEVQNPHLQVAGITDFTAKGSGTSEKPVVNAHVQVSDLVLNGDPIGSITADAVTHGRQMQLTAHSNFPTASLSLDGNVDLEGEMPGKVNLKFTALDVNPFLPVQIRGQVTHHASLGGEAELSGPFRQPRQLSGSLHIREFSVEVEHVPLKSDGPVDLAFANGIVSVQHCALVSEDTRFTLAGTMSLEDERRLDLRANGSLNLKLAQTINPDLTSYGTASLNLTINGTAASPLMNGRVEVEHAGVSMIDLPAGLGDVNGTLIFNQHRLEIEKLTGRMGGGQVKLGGYVTYDRILGFDLTADGTEIRFRYAGISVTSNQDLHLVGTWDNASLTGNVTVTRFAQIPSSDLQFVLAQASSPARIPDPKSPLNNLHLEIRILSTPELTVQTSLAKLSGDVDLRLRGTGARPVLLGRINIAEGDIKVAGTKYHLERGDITFLDPVRIDPVLDVEATTRVRDYDITIGLHGTLERLNTTYRSDPPLSADDIVSLLAFGRTQTESAMGGTSSPGFAESASGALLSSAINSATANRVSKIFGSSIIRINPSVGGPDNDPNARLTVEQQVSSNVTFTYITNLARSAQEVIQFEYNINSEYTVQGIRDENGVVSFDLLIRKRKR